MYDETWTKDSSYHNLDAVSADECYEPVQSADPDFPITGDNPIMGNPGKIGHNL